MHLAPTVREAVGPYPAGLGRPAAALFAIVPDTQLVPVLRHLGLPPAAQPRAGAAVAEALADPDRVAALIAEADPAEHEVLDRLAAGPPVGAVRNTRLAAIGTDLAPPHRLINRGLLAPLDTQRVELPREIGLALRDGAGRASSGRAARRCAWSPATPGELDRVGTTAVLEFLRLVDAPRRELDGPPAAAAAFRRRRRARAAPDGQGPRRGRAGRRPRRREWPSPPALVNSTNGMEPVFLPTAEYDVWRGRDTAQRWIVLASAWLAMTRQPSLVSQRGERDRVISALGPDAERGTIPTLRRQVLDTLTGLPPARRRAGATRCSTCWPGTSRGARPANARWPRRSSPRPTCSASPPPAASPGTPAPCSPARAAAAEHALAHALPDAVDHFLVQPDLTVVVPGPPEPAMGAELALVADLESTGGAHVYRITERSVRRALDAGRTGEQLAGFVEQHSRTPIPQALRYLIDDAARRHGVLRAGAAASYLRCDDEALLARVVAEKDADALGLRLIAPTVAGRPTRR